MHGPRNVRFSALACRDVGREDMPEAVIVRDASTAERFADGLTDIGDKFLRRLWIVGDNGARNPKSARHGALQLNRLIFGVANVVRVIKPSIQGGQQASESQSGLDRRPPTFIVG
jgi:hypothetical protein